MIIATTLRIMQWGEHCVCALGCELIPNIPHSKTNIVTFVGHPAYFFWVTEGLK